MISQEKLKILTPLQNLPKNVGDLGKLISAKGFKKLPITRTKNIARFVIPTILCTSLFINCQTASQILLTHLYGMRCFYSFTRCWLVVTGLAVADDGVAGLAGMLSASFSVS